MPRKINKSTVSLLSPILRRGGIGVLPTDTLYGIVGAALKKNTVEHVYELRKRNPEKPMIILIGDIHALSQFGIALDPAIKKILKKVWPGKVSVILPQDQRQRARIAKFKYLHRGKRTLAFRVPKDAWLQALLKETGPLIAPSANFEGRPPARTLEEAKKYFGDKVDFYVDIGRVISKPSTLISVIEGKLEVLRKGAVKI